MFRARDRRAVAGAARWSRRLRQSSAQDYAAIIAAPDRADADRQTDQRRDPVKLLAFTGVEERHDRARYGRRRRLQHRADGARGRASGKVYGQDFDTSARAKERFEARMKTDAMKNVVALARPFDDPLPAEVRELDLITFFFFYHDTTYMAVDRAAMNKKLFAALKPGGVPGHRRSFGQGRRRHLGRQDPAPDRGERARRARSRRPASSSSPSGDFLRHPEDTARGADFRLEGAGRRVRAEIPEAELSQSRHRRAMPARAAGQPRLSTLPFLPTHD